MPVLVILVLSPTLYGAMQSVHSVVQMPCF